MIIDDEQDILDIFLDIFREWGYSREAYRSPKKALHEIRENPKKYQIILSDLRMEGMDGIDLANEIQGINKEIRIIFTTGYEITDVIRKRLETLPAPAIVLRKPFGMDKLRAVLESLPKQSSRTLDQPG